MSGWWETVDGWIAVRICRKWYWYHRANKKKGECKLLRDVVMVRLQESFGVPNKSQLKLFS